MPINSIIASDCGSTTTKAILIERREGEYRLITRGEAPTTVEAPFDDVTIGVISAVREVEELAGRRIVSDDSTIILPAQDANTGVDLYVSTSSAGGGLQMSVTGVVKNLTAESAERAALGAGAIVMDTVAIDDGRKEFERIERIRNLRPDMVLLAGGTDGGAINQVVEVAEMLLAADPKPRLGIGYRLPIVYAGNKDARAEVEKLLAKSFDLKIVDNIRPTMEAEDLHPAREAIHELFLHHVMQQAPGYHKLISWTSADVMATPNAFGKMIQTVAETRGNVLAVDIGGATTDVFTVFGGHFHRTVSANLGMSYSVCNVLAEAGTANIMRWLPFELDETEVRNRMRNKMIRPTTIPQTLQDLQLEQAIAREALRLALLHHLSLAVTLRGTVTDEDLSKRLAQTATGESIVSLMTLDLVIGSGGVLSHAPNRAQAALMMLDAFQPEGVTELAVDSIFMIPQLGVLSQVLPEAAMQVFERDCLVPIAASIAPVGVAKAGERVMTLTISGGLTLKPTEIKFGELRKYPLAVGEKAKVKLVPARGFDVGEGPGKEREVDIQGGTTGVIIDARGRPLQLPADPAARTAKMQEWLRALGIAVGK